MIVVGRGDICREPGIRPQVARAPGDRVGDPLSRGDAGAPTSMRFAFTVEHPVIDVS